MKIINDFPPNFEDIAKKFELKDFKPVFAYGDILYNPSGGPISEDLMKHEETHERQQKIIGVNDWWVRYLNDETFRLTQEVEAYREQYKAIKHYPRDLRRGLLQEMARNLSSKLYGKIINLQEAKDLIINYV